MTQAALWIAFCKRECLIWALSVLDLVQDCNVKEKTFQDTQGALLRKWHKHVQVWTLHVRWALCRGSGKMSLSLSQRHEPLPLECLHRVQIRRPSSLRPDSRLSLVC